MKYLLPLLASACVVLSASPLAAQYEAARRHIEQGVALASAGDTLLAFAEFEKAVDLAPSLADAHYQIGRLYTERASAIETDFRDRRRAEEALLEALRLDPNDPRYLLELGRLRMKQHMNLDATRLLNRSLKAAQGRGDPEVLAEVNFSVGYMKEMSYQAMRHRRFRPMFRGAPVTDLRQMHDDRGVTRYTNTYLDENAPIENSGDVTRDEMLEHYRAALRADPAHVGAATRLMGYLLDEYRLSEYLGVARRLQAANPDRPEPYLYIGLGYHAAGREDAAAEAFEDGMARLSDDDRAALENLTHVMRRRVAEDYQDLDEEEREAFHEQYWLLNDPLFLTEGNERQLEHFSRVAYADLRFSAPSAGQRGWETDRGTIFIRYGQPAEIGIFGAETSRRGDTFNVGRRSIIWSYGDDGPVFIFQQMPGYLDARFAGDYEFIAENVRYVMPVKYDNIPSIPEMLELPVQIARFKGAEPDEVAVEIHAALPLDSLARDLDMEKGQIETGMFVVNSRGETIIRRVETQILTYSEASHIDELRSWRVLMQPSDVLVAAVEARDQLTWRAAASRDTFTAEAFPANEPALSDILIADVVRPLVEDPTVREDYYIVPNPAMRFGSGEKIHIYYELYGLGTDSEGFASYDVALAVKVEKLYRGGTFAEFLGALADAWGFSVVGDDRLELTFSREVKIGGRDRLTEYLELDPEKAPPGEYEIRLRVWDRLNERMVTRTRIFKVTENE